MDGNSNFDQSPGSGLTGVTDRKKLLIIIGVGIFITSVIAIVFFMLSQSRVSSRQNPGQTNNTGDANNGTTNVETQVSPTVDEEPGRGPEIVALEFYNWYVNHPDPLKSGEYLARGDITQEYKEIMGRYVRRGMDPGRDPVFNCGDPVLPKVVRTLPAEFDEEGALSLVILEEPASRINMFQIKLAKVDSVWLVRDVWCAPFEEGQ
jgi:hypothetical protein